MSDNFRYYLQQYQKPELIFIIGGGPSLKKIDLLSLQHSNHFIICCNQAFQLFPNARIAHHSDYNWWQQYQIKLEQQFKGDLITGCGLGSTLSYPSNVTRLSTSHYENHHELFTLPTMITGNNCGLQALVLAHLFKPQHIILIGFDFKATNNTTHGYNKADLTSIEHYQKFWNIFLKDFKRFEHLKKIQWNVAFPNIEMPKIWNLNPDSALEFYDKSKNLADFI